MPKRRGRRRRHQGMPPHDGNDNPGAGNNAGAGRRQSMPPPGGNDNPSGGNNAGVGRHPRRDSDNLCCALCRRSVDRTTVHHLIPRARGGRHGPTARFCPTCHRQVHALFTETTLAEELYSVERLRAHPRVAAFLKWMRRQRGASFAVRRAQQRG